MELKKPNAISIYGLFNELNRLLEEKWGQIEALSTKIILVGF